MQKTVGRVIMFDGPDGVGKTTQIELAKQALEQQGHKVFVTRVMGGSPIGEALRKVAFSDLERPAQTDAHIILAMYWANAEIIDKKRAGGVTILIDRSPLTIIAYQVYGSGLDKTEGYKTADGAIATLKPDLIICYDAPLETAMKRLASGPGHKKDYFEKKPKDYFERVAEGYKAAARRYSAKVIDGTGTIDEVHALTMSAISA